MAPCPRQMIYLCPSLPHSCVFITKPACDMCVMKTVCLYYSIIACLINSFRDFYRFAETVL